MVCAAFLLAPATASAITVSGTAMKDELGHTWQGCSTSTNNLRIAVNGVAGGTTSCNPTTGTFSFAGVTVPAIGAHVVIWFDGAAAKGALYTTAASTVANIAGLTPTQDRVWVRTEQGAITLDESLLESWTSADDPDVPLTSAYGFEMPGAEMHIDAPVTLDMDKGIDATSVHIENGATLTGGDWMHISVSGNGVLDCANGPGLARPLCVDPGGVLTPFVDGVGPYTRVYYWGQTGAYAIEPGNRCPGH